MGLRRWRFWGSAFYFETQLRMEAGPRPPPLQSSAPRTATQIKAVIEAGRGPMG